MKIYVQEGKTLTLTAPYAVASGDGALVGSFFGVAVAAYANAAEGEFALAGVFDLAALNTDTGAVGTKVYWDNTNKRVTVTAPGNTLIGALTKIKSNGDTTARVRLNGTVS